MKANQIYRHSSHETRSTGQKIVFVIAWILLALYCAFVLFFFVFGVLIAMKKNQQDFITDQINRNLFSWPAHPSFESFKNAFHELGSIDAHSTFLSITWNSIWRTTIYSALSILSSAMVCYILVFYRSRMTKFLYNLGLLVTILPLYGSAGAIYRLYSNLNLINNPLILWTAVTLYGPYFFYMYSFFKSLSWEYAEAAFIDGAGHFRVFFRIMLPMALPSISALFVMSFISGWNDYESTLLYMGDYPNLSYAVYAYEQISKYTPNIPAYFAGILISLIPILILFLIFQNSIMDRVHLGGLKG